MKSSIPRCHYVHPTGAGCNAPALRQRDYCRWHLSHIGRRMKAARARSRNQPLRLVLPLLENPIDVHIALMQVIDAIAANDIDPRQARQLLTAIRAASNTLKHACQWKQQQEDEDNPESLFTSAENATAEWPSFEQEYDLPPDLDLSLEPEVAFPPQPAPPPVDDSPLRARIRRVLDDAQSPLYEHLTADDMELMEVRQREGEQAMVRRAVGQQRARRRLERRQERAQYEALALNHNLKIEAQQLLREEGWRAQAQADEAERLAHLARVGYPDQLKQRWSASQGKAPQPQVVAAESVNTAVAASGGA